MLDRDVSLHPASSTGSPVATGSLNYDIEDEIVLNDIQKGNRCHWCIIV